MSYDLYFVGRKLTEEEFSGYFASRAHYQVNGSQAFYRNEDTGVYFSFDRNVETEKSDPDSPHYDAMFNLNFFRPHIFGLEAEPEVNAFKSAFDFSIHDPQNDGMGDGPYSTAGFIRGWNSGNEFGYRAILSNPQTEVASLSVYPGDALEKIWSWNAGRNAIQSEYGEDLYVPKIIFVRSHGQVASCIIWGDAIPTLIPRVDRILVPRKELAPRILFQKKDDLCMTDFETLTRAFGNYRTNDYPLPGLLLPHPEPTAKIQDFVRRLAPLTEKVTAVSADQVLDFELVEKHRPSTDQ